MHHIAEVVIPPRADIENAIKQVMTYFCDEGSETADWWDFYVIGGRFSGSKIEATLDTAQLERFHEVLHERKVTVHGVQAGKQKLSPASQIPMVDMLWREMFPGKGEHCILFAHAADQYGKHGIYERDICAVAAIPDNLKCDRLIVAGPHWKVATDLQPKRMLVAEIWNHIEYQKTQFDGNVKRGLEHIRTDDRSHEQMDIADDWLCVTVDYHN